MQINKRKIINDPIYGFITIPDELIFDIIEHPYFQRLRRIKQLGLTHLVYPGALHTRFHHALGAMHLMTEAIDLLRLKGNLITEDEALSAMIAILLHDIGHGPFSHSLENSIVKDMKHEYMSEVFMNVINKQFDNRLEGAISIYKGLYPKKFLHQLVSGQLDVDRLDYLKRDSFFTGVSEGVIGTDRIIKMMNVCKDSLVIEDKGIYSIEKFIVARRLMYWQVYFHKTVLSAENLLIKILDRANFLTHRGEKLFATPALSFFLSNTFTKQDFNVENSAIENFALLDDDDVNASIKVWINDNDKILSFLSQSLINRHLFKIEMSNLPFDEDVISQIKNKVSRQFSIDYDDTSNFVMSGHIENNAYNPRIDKINILYRNGEIKDISEAFEQINVTVLSETQKKFYLCYPKTIK